MSGDFKVEYLPNGDFNVVSLSPKAAAPAATRLPPYVFDDAVVMLDGQRDVVRNAYHKAGVDGALWVHFKSGQDICFDAKRVQPPLGILPSIIYTGAVVDLLAHAHNPKGEGSWTVKDFYFSQRDNEPQARLHLKLAQGDRMLDTVFNAKTVREQGGFEKIRLVKRITLKPPTPK